MKKLIIIFVLFISNVASASNICASLFQINLLIKLEEVNNSNNNYIAEATIESKILSLKKRKQKQIKRILERVQTEGVSSQRELYNVSNEIIILLSGNRDLIDRYFFKSKDERKKESIRFQVQQQLMQKGLEGFLKENSKNFKVNLWIQTKLAIRKLLNSQFFNWYQLPWMLPRFRDKQLSEELLQKIIWSGIDANKLEIQKHYELQSYKEFYASMRRLYAGAFLGMSLIYTYNGALDYIQKQNITEQDLKVTEDLAFEKATDSFIALMNREPNNEELTQIKKIIYTTK
ncbi:MAG: hypothetical protein V4596_03750 [Bdellovibrionota bacterium]